jgi:hypothetical protein
VRKSPHRGDCFTARKKNSPKLVNKEEDKQSDTPYHAGSVSWSQRLKRVFNIDITECVKCQKHIVTIIACITDTLVIQKILKNLNKKHPTTPQTRLLPPLRAPTDEDHDFTIQRDFNFGA